jgi:hypothetical protein
MEREAMNHLNTLRRERDRHAALHDNPELTEALTWAIETLPEMAGALENLLEEYESQESQFGSDILWQKYAGNEAAQASAVLQKYNNGARDDE